MEMKKVLLVLGILIAIVALLVIVVVLLTPWMDRWGTTPEERAAEYPCDELVAQPARIVNRAVTIHATPEQIYPWILQIGADKSGMYSYTWLENLVGCKMAKVEAIKPEWQNLKEGDLMKMCAGDFAPPPYLVAKVIENQAVIFGHKDNDKWAEEWEFVLIPQADGTTRLVTRTRTNMTGGFWEVIRPISFMMEQKMLWTIKYLSEKVQ
jgi:hypothetical protein